MAVEPDLTVLLVTAGPTPGGEYLDRIGPDFRVRHESTVEGAVEALEEPIDVVLLVDEGFDRPLEEVIAALTEPGSIPPIGVLTDRSLEELPASVGGTLPPTASGSEVRSLVARLLGVEGLERAINSYGRLAIKRAAVAERGGDDGPTASPEHDSLTRELKQRRDQIERYLDRLADPEAGGRLRSAPVPGSEQPTDQDERREPPPDEPQSRLEKLRTAESGGWAWLRVGVVPFVLVLVVFGLLFAVSGTWPAIVGVSSDSMAPQLQPGDVVLLTAPGRFAPAFADTEIGVVTAGTARSNGYRSLGGYGSVIVFKPPSRDGPATIHRVQFRVSAGENWIDRANPSYLSGASCAAIENCPAPHDGFITKGDNNDRYDQSSGLAPPVRDDWVMGVARYRIPLGILGEVIQWLTADLTMPAGGSPVGGR